MQCFIELFSSDYWYNNEYIVFFKTDQCGNNLMGISMDLFNATLSNLGIFFWSLYNRRYSGDSRWTGFLRVTSILWYTPRNMLIPPPTHYSPNLSGISLKVQGFIVTKLSSDSSTFTWFTRQSKRFTILCLLLLQTAIWSRRWGLSAGYGLRRTKYSQRSITLRGPR